jgi:isoleucyl-tRNA synthetase
VKDTSVCSNVSLPNPSEGGASEHPVTARLFSSVEDSGGVFLMAWTTTPWTLPSNLGLTVGPNIDYVLVKTFNTYTHLPINVILAKALLAKYFKPEAENGDFNNYKEGDKVFTMENIIGV